MKSIEYCHPYPLQISELQFQFTLESVLHEMELTLVHFHSQVCLWISIRMVMLGTQALECRSIQTATNRSATLHSLAEMASGLNK